MKTLTTLSVDFGKSPAPESPEPLTLERMLADARASVKAETEALVQEWMARPIVPPPLATLQAGITDPHILAAMASMYETYTVPIYARWAAAMEALRPLLKAALYEAFKARGLL